MFYQNVSKKNIICLLLAAVAIILFCKPFEMYPKAVAKENAKTATLYSEFEKFGTHEFVIPLDASLSKELMAIINQYSLQTAAEINTDMVFGIILEDGQKNGIIFYPDGQSKTYIQIFGSKTNYFYAPSSLYTELSKALEPYISAETAYYTPIVTVSEHFNLIKEVPLFKRKER